jgi:hypothetical protein
VDVLRRHPQQYLAGAAEFAKLLKDKPDHLLQPPIRIETKADVPVPSVNVAIEYRLADDLYDRLSAELTDLTQRKVGVIVFVGAPSLGRLTAAREAMAEGGRDSAVQQCSAAVYLPHPRGGILRAWGHERIVGVTNL